MNKHLLSLVAAPLVLMSTCALAQDPTVATSATQRTTQVAQTPGIKLTMTGALRVAQAEMQGRILGARFEMWHGQPTYLVRIYTSRSLPAIWQGRIDANTAEPVGQPSMLWHYQWSSRLGRNVAALRRIQTPLVRAVRMDVKAGSGKVTLAAVRALPNGRAAFRFELVKNDQQRVVTIGTQQAI